MYYVDTCMYVSSNMQCQWQCLNLLTSINVYIEVSCRNSRNSYGGRLETWYIATGFAQICLHDGCRITLKECKLLYKAFQHFRLQRLCIYRLIFFLNYWQGTNLL